MSDIPEPKKDIPPISHLDTKRLYDCEVRIIEIADADYYQLEILPKGGSWVQVTLVPKGEAWLAIL